MNRFSQMTSSAGRVVPMILALGLCGLACDGDDLGSGQAESGSVGDEDSSGEADSTEQSTSGEGEDSDASESQDGDNEAIGLCFIESEAQLADGKYTGWVDYVLAADHGDGDELCRLRFSIEGSLTGAPDCPDCLWTAVVQLSEPMHVIDVEGTCANSQRALDEAAIAALVKAPFGQGFLEEFVGHESLVVEHDLSSEGSWETRAAATWKADSGKLHWYISEGFCSYIKP